MREIAGVAPIEDRIGLAAEASPKFFPLEELLPLEVVRVHTKTADIPVVTDEQLRLYRKSAFEAAMQYTSLYLGPLQLLTEYLDLPRPRIGGGINVHRHNTIRTKYALARSEAYLYGMTSPMLLQGKIGSKKIQAPHHDPNSLLAGMDCCNPCGNGGNTNQSRIMYYAGYDSVESVQGGVLVGMLKFIAWNVMNPGDEIMTVRNRRSIAEAGLTGTNNAAWASGALELWRQYNDEAV